MAWAVRPVATGVVSGWLTLMDIQPANAAIETRPHLVRSPHAAHARRHGGDVPAAPPRRRRAGLPPAGVEVQRAQRALPPGGGAAGLHAIEGDAARPCRQQGPAARHGDVLHPGRRVAALPRRDGRLAGPGQFRGGRHGQARHSQASAPRRVFSQDALDHLLGEYGYGLVFVVIMLEAMGLPVPGREPDHRRRASMPPRRGGCTSSGHRRRRSAARSWGTISAT